ncbi:MAG: hypothetical protein HKN28_09715 [Alphaproteobacteria bacterium]|nr:hypothetical protein [Alphaproteobacteria bacterium]
MTTRNVINVSSVDLFVEDFAQRTDHPALKRWLTSNVRRWILKHYDRADRVVRDPATSGYALTDAHGPLRPLPDAVPDWCALAIERGDDVIHLRLGATLRKRISRTLTVLAAELEDGTLPSADHIPFPKAEAKAKKQRQARYIEQRKARVAKATVPVYQAATGDTIIVLTARESLADEGSRMAHCVATYDEEIQRDECRIFSVRDPHGKPRATIEADCDGRIWQIKGFANGAVEPRYRLAVQNFIRNYRYLVEDDQHNLLTEKEALKGDPEKLATMLIDQGGLEFLHAARFGGYKVLRDAHLDLSLRAIVANADSLPEPVLTAIFEALKPGTSEYLYVHRIALYSIYGITVSLHYVEMPLPLLYLVRQGVFKNRRVAHEARAIYRASEAAVVRLCLAPPNKLFALGLANSQEPWESGLLEYPANVLLRSPIDTQPLRAARQIALRRAMNKAQRQQAVHRSQPSQAHVAVRELIDGARGLYVL